MGRLYTGWFDGWQNARQRQAIRDLDVELSTLSSTLSQQRSESRRLRSQISQLQGTLEQKVDRLAESLSALVELTDVQLVLAMFDPSAMVRHRAREAITICEVGAVTDLPPLPEDVPDYWLGPAVRALVALVRGEPAGDLLEAAEQRDRRRTAVLLTSGLTLAGHGALAQRWLPDALGTLVAEVPATHAQRTLWTIAGSGGFGAAGQAAVSERLAELVGGLTPERERAEAAAWAEQVGRLAGGLSGPRPGPPATPAGVAPVPAGSGSGAGRRGGSGGATVKIPSVVSDDGSLQRALAASEKLSTLRELCGQDGGAAAAGAVPSPRRAADDVPGSEPVALDEGSREELAEVLHALVDEGTPEEAPLLRRAAELRASIENGAETELPASWDGDAGSPCELLRTDAFDPDRPALAALARHAGRRWLLAAADELAEQAAANPPAEATVRVFDDQVRVRPAGPDSWDLSRVRNQIEQRPVVDPAAGRLVRWLAIAGAVLCLPVVFWPNGLAILSVLAGIGLLIGAGVRWFRERQARTDRTARKQVDLATLQRTTDRAAAELAELHQQVTEATERAAADIVAIRTRLSG